MALTVPLRMTYGSMALFITILNNVFILYYVEMFVSVYKIDRTSFWIGEVRLTTTYSVMAVSLLT